MEDLPYFLNRIAYLRDEKAYKAIYLYFHPKLFRFCLGIVKDVEAAEEIVSDILLKIWTMENRLNLVEDIDLYLFKAVKNASLTWLSKQKIQSLPFESIDANTNFNNSVESAYINTETGREIEKAVRSLPEQCQLVFRLVKQEGFSYKEVHNILDISQNTIESHMRTALRRIKMQLEQYLAGKK